MASKEKMHLGWETVWRQSMTTSAISRQAAVLIAQMKILRNATA